MRFKFLAALLLSAAMHTPAAARTLNVVATFTVLADVVKNVGGGHVVVTSLVGPNGDPHEFEPSPNDARNLRTADAVFVSGEGLEGWMDRLIAASGYGGIPVVASAGIKTRDMDEDGREVIDPHVWNDPSNVVVWIENIERALAEKDPEDSAAFKANADSYRKQVEDLDSYARKAFGGIAQNRRKVLTSHDAFGYFGRAYGITFLSPVGLSTNTEASAAGVAELIDQIKGEGIKVYFFENSNDPRLIKQIANATGAVAGGELYVEALSPEEGPAATYAKMFKYNVDQLAAAIR